MTVYSVARIGETTASSEPQRKPYYPSPFCSTRSREQSKLGVSGKAVPWKPVKARSIKDAPGRCVWSTAPTRARIFLRRRGEEAFSSSRRCSARTPAPRRRRQNTASRHPAWATRPSTTATRARTARVPASGTPERRRDFCLCGFLRDFCACCAWRILARGPKPHRHQHQQAQQDQRHHAREEKRRGRRGRREKSEERLGAGGSRYHDITIS